MDGHPPKPSIKLSAPPTPTASESNDMTTSSSSAELNAVTQLAAGAHNAMQLNADAVTQPGTVKHVVAVHESGALLPPVSEGTIDFQSVVKIFVSCSSVSYKMPWQRSDPENMSGSGFLLPGKLVLTNMHVVEDATSILVRRHGSARKYEAHVACMGWQCDLALLTVADERFWKDHKSVTLGGVPQLRDSVSCVGYPTGGDNLSVTCGVVSRVDVHHNCFNHTSLLTVQIDAAINSGNSGGPVFNASSNEAGGSRVVGVAFLTHVCSQNIGYIIPIPVVELFLQDYKKHGRALGFCSDDGFEYQTMENRTLRRFHRMEESQTGVCVQHIARLSPFHALLEENDILLKIDDVPIGDDATIAFRADERILFTHLFARVSVGESVSATVLRDGKLVDIGSIPLRPFHHLVPRLHNYDCIPSYYIVAGLVFQPLTGPLLEELYENWHEDAPSCITWHYHYGNPADTEQQIIILTQIMSSSITIGYPSGTNVKILSAFDGKPVRNLREFAVTVERFLDPYRELAAESVPQGGSTYCESKGHVEPEKMMRFDLGEPGTSQMHIVLDPVDVLRESDKILETHQIARKSCSVVSKALADESAAESSQLTSVV